MSSSRKQQAKGAKDAAEAAKLRERWMRDLLERENLSESGADTRAEAIDQLEDRFPELMGVAVGEADDFIRRTKRKAGPKKPDPIGKAAKDTGAAVAKREKAPAKPKPAAAPKRRGRAPSQRTLKRRTRRARSPALRRATRRAYRDTGIPGAASSTTSMALSVFGVTVGLSLLYLLISNAQRSGPGRSAVAQIAGGTARAVETLILPVDPLRGMAANKPIRTIPADVPGWQLKLLREQHGGDGGNFGPLPNLKKGRN